MAIIDSKLVFCDNQAYSDGSAGDIESTNSIDLGDDHTTHYPGNGTPLYVNCTISTAASTTAGTSIQAFLQDSADNSTFATVAAGEVVLAAAQTVGTKMLDGIILPSNIRRYVQVMWTAVGSIVNTGSASAQLSLGNIDNT